MNKYSFSAAILLFTYSAHAFSGSWYTERLAAVTNKNNCSVEYGEKDNPGHFLITPNFFIAWCSSSNTNSYNLIAFSSIKNNDWDACGELIKVKERNAKKTMRIKNGVDPYGKLFPMYKFWSLDSLNKNIYDYLQSEELASGKGIYYGNFSDFETIVYCHKGQWVMSSFH